MLGEHARVTGGLRRDELAEGERALGDREVFGRRLRDLQEHADGGTALVELPGRVQEARAPAEGDRAAGARGEQVAEPLELGVRDAVDVGLDRDVAVVAGSSASSTSIAPSEVARRRR